MKQWTILFLLAGLVFYLVGCGSGSQLSGLVPGQGVVYYDGVPLASATISLTPVQQSDEMRGASATTDENGAFILMTLNRNDGVRPGEYVVTVSKTERPPPIDAETMQQMMSGLIPPPPLDTEIKHLINPRYADERTSGISVTIGPRGDRNIEIRLESR